MCDIFAFSSRIRVLENNFSQRLPSLVNDLYLFGSSCFQKGEVVLLENNDSQMRESYVYNNSFVKKLFLNLFIPVISSWPYIYIVSKEIFFSSNTNYNLLNEILKVLAGLKATIRRDWIELLKQTI